MKKFLACLAVGMALLGMSGKDASATLINFDNVASGTDISNYYTGVTFSARLCPNGAASCGASTNPVYAVSSPFAVSPGNVVSPSSIKDVFGVYGTTSFPVTDNTSAAIEAAFSNLQSSVSITVNPAILVPEAGSGYAKPYISAFDSSNNFLGITYYSGVLDPTLPPPANGIETLTITSALGNIAMVRFTVQDKAPHTLASFDNLQFTLTGSENSVNPIRGGGGNGTAVPEPGTLILLGSGMAGLAATRAIRFRTKA